MNQPHLYSSFIEQSMGFDYYRGAQEFSYASTRTFARCQGTKRSGVVARLARSPEKCVAPHWCSGQRVRLRNPVAAGDTEVADGAMHCVYGIALL
jgi:hypothetical protein